MAQTICCPCGSPIDCDNLELVITVECPRCRKELHLELQGENGNPATRRAMLTVMEGPYWVGEQFVLPVGEVLRIGQATGNWLSLEGGSVSDVHCRLQLTPQGAVIVEDHQSKSGTWFGDQRIMKGRLIPRSSFKIGEFRFRLDLASPDGTTITAVPSLKGERPVALPTMSKVQRRNTPQYWAFRNRFMLSRYVLLIYAWLGGLYHAMGLRGKALNPWPWQKSIIVGVVVAAAMSFACRRVTLSHKHLKYLSLLLLLVLALVDMNLTLPGGAVAALFIASALLVLVVREPSEWMALFGSVLAVVGGVIIAVCSFQQTARTLHF